MGIKSCFGKNLKSYRKERHFSQEELSEQVGISVKHLSAIERGLSFVSAELLDKFSLSLELPVFVFFIQDREFFYNDTMLDALDRIIEKHLLNTIKEIKSDIRQNNKPALPYKSIK
jgi:transcriptional regulator with XRE-family HTH domain